MAKRLLQLNGIAILCVVLFHATGFGFTAMFSWAHRYRAVTSPNYDQVGTAPYFALRIIEQFVVFCLPAFLFVSGFFVAFLLGRSGVSIDIRAQLARAKNLVVPYLFWSSLVLIGYAAEGRILSEGRYVRILLTGAANETYYYVPMLLQLYLIAPFLAMLARARPAPVLTLAAVIQVAVYLLQYVVVLGVGAPGLRAVAAALPKWLFVTQVFWFTFGVVAGLHQHSLKAYLRPMRRALPVAAGGLFLLGLVEWELLLHQSGTPWIENRVTLIDGCYSAAVILSVLAHADVEWPFAATLSTLGAQSYGIYLSHSVVMEYAARGLYHFAPLVLGHQALFQPVLIVVGIGLPLVLMALGRLGPAKGLYAHVFG